MTTYEIEFFISGFAFGISIIALIVSLARR